MFDEKHWEKVDKRIPGWMSKEEAKFLVENIQGNIYLEIGVAYGKSMELVRLHYPEIEIEGVDLIDHGVDKIVENVDIRLLDSKKMWLNYEDEEIDTLFIDGDHTYDGCLADLIYWFNKVEKGGKIIFHDYGRPTREHEGVTKSVDAIKSIFKDFKSTNYIACGTKH